MHTSSSNVLRLAKPGEGMSHTKAPTLAAAQFSQKCPCPWGSRKKDDEVSASAPATPPQQRSPETNPTLISPAQLRDNNKQTTVSCTCVETSGSRTRFSPSLSVSRDRADPDPYEHCLDGVTPPDIKVSIMSCRADGESFRRASVAGCADATDADGAFGKIIRGFCVVALVFAFAFPSDALAFVFAIRGPVRRRLLDWRSGR